GAGLDRTTAGLAASFAAATARTTAVHSDSGILAAAADTGAAACESDGRIVRARPSDSGARPAAARAATCTRCCAETAEENGAAALDGCAVADRYSRYRPPGFRAAVCRSVDRHEECVRLALGRRFRQVRL